MATNDLVVSTETGGLGNRLKSWVSSMRLAPDARVHWPVTKNMPAAFGELFVNHMRRRRRTDRTQRFTARGGSPFSRRTKPYLPAGFATVGAGAHPSFGA